MNAVQISHDGHARIRKAERDALPMLLAYQQLYAQIGFGHRALRDSHLTNPALVKIPARQDRETGVLAAALAAGGHNQALQVAPRVETGLRHKLLEVRVVRLGPAQKKLPKVGRPALLHIDAGDNLRICRNQRNQAAVHTGKCAHRAQRQTQ
jgi:hypothetical protein